MVNIDRNICRNLERFIANSHLAIEESREDSQGALIGLPLGKGYKGQIVIGDNQIFGRIKYKGRTYKLSIKIRE